MKTAVEEKPQLLEILVHFLPKVLGNIVSDYFTPNPLGSTHIASFGTARLKSPRGIAVDPQKNVYITDESKHRISVWTFQGQHVGNIGDFNLSEPRGVCYYKDELFVGDNVRITVFNSKGDYLRAFNKEGYADGQFYGPCGVLVHDDIIYVSNTNFSQVHIFDLNGKFLRKFGNQRGTEAGQLNGPVGLAISEEKELYVVSSLNNRVDVFSLEGKFIRNFGSKGSGAGQLEFPQYIALCGEEVLVTDFNNHRISVFNQKGEFLRSFGSKGSRQGFTKPTGLAYAGGKLFVTQCRSDIVHIFE